MVIYSISVGVMCYWLHTVFIFTFNVCIVNYILNWALGDWLYTDLSFMLLIKYLDEPVANWLYSFSLLGYWIYSVCS